MSNEEEEQVNKENTVANQTNLIEEKKSPIENIKTKKNVINTGFYDKRYYEKLELIDDIMNFIQKHFKRNNTPFNESISIDLKHLTELKELVGKLFAYFNVLPMMQKKCLDKNINDLINMNFIKVSDFKKKISFIERDIKKAKYNLISKKDLYELLKKRGLE